MLQNFSIFTEYAGPYGNEHTLEGHKIVVLDPGGGAIIYTGILT